jgi:hypothetical protein
MATIDDVYNLLQQIADTIGVNEGYGEGYGDSNSDSYSFRLAQYPRSLPRRD